MKEKYLILLTVFSFVLCSCVTPPRNKHAEFETRIQKVESVGLFQPYIQIFELKADGTRLQRDDLSRVGEENVLHALRKFFEENPSFVKPIVITKDIEEEMEDILALFRAVSQSIQLHGLPGPALLPEKQKNFDYSVGSIQPILEKTGLDSLLLFCGTEEIPTGGRRAATATMAAAAFIVVGAPLAIPLVFALATPAYVVLKVAIIESSGVILWHSAIGGEGKYDFVDPETSAAFVTHALKDLPGLRFGKTALKVSDPQAKGAKEERPIYASGGGKKTEIRKVTLRRIRKETSISDVEAMIQKYNFFVKNRNDKGNFPNDFIDNRDGTVTDTTTELMWQKGGALSALSWNEAEQYVQQLNKQGFGSYYNWRIPTVEELASLLKGKVNAKGLHIDPLFDSKQKEFWSSDFSEGLDQSSSKNLVINFSKGSIGERLSDNTTTGQDLCSVRAVRTLMLRESKKRGPGLEQKVLTHRAYPYTMVNSSKAVGGLYKDNFRNFSVELPDKWRAFNISEYALTQDLLISKDGLYLQYILINRRNVEKPFENTKKEIKKGMLPEEISEVILDDIGSDQTVLNLEIIENVPVMISGIPGFKAVFTYKNADGLKLKSIYYGFLHEEQFYTIRYNAALRHYFKKDLETFEQILKSFKLIKKARP